MTRETVPPSPAVMRFFDAYVQRRLARTFARVWLWDGPEAPALPSGPLVFAVSHSAWWDVLVGYHLARRIVRRPSAAPMDAAQLARYRVLARLGVYGVARGTAAGARAFLRDTSARLASGCAVWMTPQGEFVPHWHRPVVFQDGIGHLVRRVPGLTVVPVAIAYEHRAEPRPEVFVRFGAPVAPDPAPPARLIARRLARELEATLDGLRAALVLPDAAAGFVPIVEGATSTSLVYDRVRAVHRALGFAHDPPRHADVVSDPRRRRSA